MAKVVDGQAAVSTEDLIESASFRLAGDLNLEYLVYNFSILNFLSSGGIVVMVRIFERTDLNCWQEVQLRLGFWQRLLNLIDNYWPPEEVLEVRIEDRALVMYYHETDSPYEVPFFGNGDRIWRAAYDSKVKKWITRRLKDISEVPFRAPRDLRQLVGDRGKAVFKALDELPVRSVLVENCGRPWPVNSPVSAGESGPKNNE